MNADTAKHNNMTDKAKKRKDTPVFSGVINYFPDAIKEVSRVSFVGNEQHNPGADLFWDRSKSGDELDALSRHLVDAGTLDDDGLRHSAKVAWRALANLQKEIENDRQMGYEEDIIKLSKEDNDMYPERKFYAMGYGPCSAHAFYDEELLSDKISDYPESNESLYDEELTNERMKNIGRNGNDGIHYGKITTSLYPGDIDVTYEIQTEER